MKNFLILMTILFITACGSNTVNTVSVDTTQVDTVKVDTIKVQKDTIKVN